MISRRHLIAGAASFPIAASPLAGFAQSSTPVASPVASTAPTTADVLPAWLDAQSVLQAQGEVVSSAFWSNSREMLVAVADPAVAQALQLSASPEEMIASFTTDQVQFSFAEAGAWFFGQYTPEHLVGTFLQGGALPWSATPDEPQSDTFPTGNWTGTIGPGVIDLGIDLEFSGNEDSMEILLSIPEQRLSSHPMSDIAFAENLEIGELLDTRILPAGGDVAVTNTYAEQYIWGNHTVVLNTYWNGAGQLAGINLLPQATLPEIEERDPIVARLPFDGAWMVFWGGETEFRNYHAAHAAQRFAVDLAVWKDGATAGATGTDNESYYAFGQPYLAPVSGTVVAVSDGLEDIPPQTQGDPSHHPAGNHVVIETDGGFVFLAHCQQGSIQVNEGDAITSGDVVAWVGNSGNTSEAHVHIHAQTSMDMLDPNAVGIPLIFEGALENGEPVEQLSVLHGTIVEHSL